MMCSAKGCGEMQTPYIDQKTNEVHCSVCDQVIVNVSDFTKRQMLSLKQFQPKKKETFAVKCNKCNKESCPRIVDDQVVCSECALPLDNLSPFFQNMLKTQLKESKE